MPNERLLWKQMIAGDERALAELMRIYYKSLISYGFKFEKNDEFIKDCIQEVFIDIWTSRERIIQPESIRAYLFVSLRRRVERNMVRAPYVQSVEEMAFPTVEFSPEWWLINEEATAFRTQKVAEFLNSLPKRQREVIYLKYYEEMSREEISSVLSITPQTVSNLLQMAYAQIRKHWKLPIISFILMFLS